MGSSPSKDLQDAFTGRIVSYTGKESPFNEIQCPHTVLYPRSEADITIALQLAAATHRPTLIQSGKHFTHEISKEFTNGLVISLQEFNCVHVNAQKHSVYVDVAATTAQVAKELAKHNLFLPLGDNPVRSILADLKSSTDKRSVRSLRHYVRSMHVVSIETGYDKDLTPHDPLFHALLDGTASPTYVIVGINFKTSLPKDHELWLGVWGVPYLPNGSLAGLIKLLFEYHWPSTVDVSLNVTMDSYFTPYVYIRLLGNKFKARDDAIAHAQKVIDRTFLRGRVLPTLFHRSLEKPGEIVAAWAATCVSGGSDHDEPCTKFQRLFFPGWASHLHEHSSRHCDEPEAETAPHKDDEERSDTSDSEYESLSSSSVDETKPVVIPFGQACTNFAEAVDFALGAESVAHGIRGSAQLKLERNHAMQATVHLFTYWQHNDHDRRAFALMSAVLKEVGFHPKVAVLAPADCDGEPFQLIYNNSYDMEIIPSFHGEVVAKSAFAEHLHAYRAYADQYATSSLSGSEVQKRMSPFMIAYPINAKDVGKAIRFAKSIGKKIVARSGGNQYLGLSSGGDDTILLSMDKFNTISVQGKRATIGVSCSLKNIAATLKSKGLSLPHGECPRVALGGHIQTGGFGHLIHSFGLTMDRVHAFQFVTADGVVKTLHRPARDKKTYEKDDELFAAVLGGGPGSFGVLTEIVVDCIPDVAVYGFQAAIVYEKSVLLAAMKEAQKWTQMLASNQKFQFGMDLSVSVISERPMAQVIEGEPYRPAFVLLEIVDTKAADADGKLNPNAPNQPFIQSVIRNVMDAKSSWNTSTPTYNTILPLSTVVYSTIRQEGNVSTRTGREFPYPYKKRLNCTKRPLTDAFITSAVDLVEETMRTGLSVSFRCLPGGGKFANPDNPASTMQQHRDILASVSFDVFYPKGFEEKANEQQAKMKRLLPLLSGGPDIRLFWGTFVDNPEELQIDNVVDKYYNDMDTYQRLQQLKKRVDPENVFSTPFQVQLPKKKKQQSWYSF